NPFFVDEVVRLLSAEGRLDSEAQVAALRIPDGVRETIRHRLAPLPDRARILLATAAVIGRQFRLDTLQRVCELEPAELDGELSRAIEYSVRAGERALALVAYEEASDHFERALQAYGLQDCADGARRCDLLLALANAQSRAGNARGARETFLRAAGLARKLG